MFLRPTTFLFLLEYGQAILEVWLDFINVITIDKHYYNSCTKKVQTAQFRMSFCLVAVKNKIMEKIFNNEMHLMSIANFKYNIKALWHYILFLNKNRQSSFMQI